ncbi:F-box domain [Arabidopsis suecica]|uniref:F-box domain n=1 Tax=Arabidopsis suecica TaxID=45249 RepID=A0A8T1XSF2_ARASU|nr:F-box domain [Arabidopsis suecica]
MVKTKICDKGSSQGSEEDRISQLPDHLICQILSHLSTKDVVRTSILSTRWRNLWQLVPVLDSNSREFRLFNEFVSFVGRFFDIHKDSCIQKLCLRISDQAGKSYLTSWIDLVTRRRIQHIDISHVFYRPEFGDIPLSLYTCDTLVHLRLSLLTMVNVEFVSLPCLKILHLEFVKYTNETTLDKLISCSPVLEDLTIAKYSEDNAKVLQVRSQTLKRVDIHGWFDRHTRLVIDTPLLQFLMIETHSIKNIEFINLGFTAKVDIDANLPTTLDPNDLSNRSMMRDFFTSISRVKSLVISYAITKDIFRYMELEPLHQFCYLSDLTAVCSISYLEMLLNLLKSCPKLESLSLKLFHYDKKKKAEVMSSTVPPCLVSSLKFVKLESQLFGCGTELKVARYFLENSTILEKLTLRNDYYAENVNHIRQTLHAIPRCSSTCEVVLL